MDFTDDRVKILAGLTAYSSSSGQGFDNGTSGTAEGTAESSGAFTADDTDYNTFSADRKLLALQSIMQALRRDLLSSPRHLTDWIEGTIRH